MKKTIFAFAILALVATAESTAQEKKFWVGGTVGFSSAKDYPSPSLTGNTLTIAPEFGYHLNDRWALGLRLGLRNAEANVGTAAAADSQIFSATPFARYTLWKCKAFSLFADGGIDFSDFTGDVDLMPYSQGDDTHLTSVGLFVSPGFAVRLTDRFSLIGRTDLFSAGYTTKHIGVGKAWAAELASPFALDDIELGFTFRF